MNITVHTKNYKLDEKTENLVNDRLDTGLEHLLRDFDEAILNATVKIEKLTRHGFKVNFNMYLPKKHQIFAEEKDEKLSLALSKLREDIERQIETYLGKLRENK